MSTSPLLHTDGSVLAAIDHSVYAASVADHASWAAARLQSPLQFVHAIERSPTPVATDLSGNLALSGQDTLLEELASADEVRSRIAQTRGRQLLDQAAQRALQQHQLEASTRLRHGSLVDTLLDLESGTRLFVIGKRGEHVDFASGHLGSNLERVMRAVHRPVLVAARSFRPVHKFLIAYDGSATTRKCVDVVCASPALQGVACDVLMAGDESATNRAHMDWAIASLRAVGFHPVARFVKGPADSVIVEWAQQQAIDLIVMGAYGHSRIRHLIVGSTTTHVLRSCQMPMLLLR